MRHAARLRITTRHPDPLEDRVDTVRATQYLETTAEARHIAATLRQRGDTCFICIDERKRMRWQCVEQWSKSFFDQRWTQQI